MIFKCPGNIWEMTLIKDGFTLAGGMWTMTQQTSHRPATSWLTGMINQLSLTTW